MKPLQLENYNFSWGIKMTLNTWVQKDWNKLYYLYIEKWHGQFVHYFNYHGSPNSSFSNNPFFETTFLHNLQ